jgi:hypothetical protein
MAIIAKGSKKDTISIEENLQAWEKTDRYHLLIEKLGL